MSKVQSDKFEMRLGLPGSGKTLTQTELIVLPALLEGLDVYVNYWINCNLENYHYFADFDEIKNEIKPNSGSSIKDQVTRLESRTENLEAKLDKLS